VEAGTAEAVVAVQAVVVVEVGAGVVSRTITAAKPGNLANRVGKVECVFFAHPQSYFI